MIELSGDETHVAALVVLDGLILLQRRSEDRAFLPGAWDVVGGRIDPGETALEALHREVQEETGLRVDRVGSWVTRVSFDLDGERCTEVGALVWCLGGTPRLERGKASAFALADAVEPFVVDNESRGYDSTLRHSAGVALEVLRAMDDRGARTV